MRRTPYPQSGSLFCIAALFIGWLVAVDASLADDASTTIITTTINGQRVRLPAPVWRLAPGETFEVSSPTGTPTRYTRTEAGLDVSIDGAETPLHVPAPVLDAMASMASTPPTSEPRLDAASIIGWRTVDLPLTDLELTTVDDAEWPLAAKRGQTVLLSFWATWCVPCLTELEYIQGWLANGGDPQIDIFAVNVGESSEEIEAFVRTHELDQLAILKASMDLFREQPDTFSASLPQLWLIDDDGRLRRMQSGLVATNASSWIEHVRAAAASIRADDSSLPHRDP